MLWHVSECHSFSRTDTIFHCVGMYYILFIHSSVDEHLDCFHFLAILSNTAVNIDVQISIGVSVFNSCGCIPKVQLLG